MRTWMCAIHLSPSDISMKALVVSADAALVRSLVSSLKSIEDIEVVRVANDGRQGIRLARELEPDIVVTQFNMPDMTGPALTRSIKTDGAGPIVVVVSVKDVPEYQTLAHRAGADGYLPRTSLDEFVPLMKKLLNGKPRPTGP
jgi:DNA-binding NarL/FixJ family response regulator